MGGGDNYKGMKDAMPLVVLGIVAGWVYARASRISQRLLSLSAPAARYLITSILGAK